MPASIYAFCSSPDPVEVVTISTWSGGDFAVRDDRGEWSLPHFRKESPARRFELLVEAPPNPEMPG